MFELKAPSPTFLGTLQTVARVATENWKLQVKWNSSQKSFTDCRTVIEIGWNTGFISSGCSNLAEWTAAIKGIAEHEIAHNLFSCSSEICHSEVVPIPEMVNYFERLSKDGMPKHIANFIRGAVEDGRVNRLHVNLSPAMIQSLQWVNELHYRNSCQIMKGVVEPLAWALNSFLERTRCGKDLQNVPEDTVRFLNSIQEFIEKGLFAQSSAEMITSSALPIAECFIDEFPDLFVPAHLVPEIEHGVHRPLEKAEGKSVPDRGKDVRVKPKKPTEPEPEETPKMPEKLVDPSSEAKSEEAGEPTEEVRDSIPTSDNSTTDEDKPEFEETLTGESSGLTDEKSEKELTGDELVPEEEGTGLVESDELEPDDLEREDDYELDGFDGAKDDEVTLPEENVSKDSSVVEEVSETTEIEESFSGEVRGTIDVDATEVEEESGELSEESAEWVDGEVSDDTVKLEDELEYSPSTADADDSAKVGSGKTTNDCSSENLSSIEEDDIEATEAEVEEALENISKWAESKEVEFEEVDFTDLFSSSDGEANEFSSKDEALERKVRAAQAEVKELDVDTSLFSVGIHSKVSFREIKIPEHLGWVDLYAREREGVVRLIDESRDALKEYLVHQKRSAQRNLLSGRIDPRRLWRASGLLDSRIFMDRENSSNSTDVAVYLLLDMSGSMSGGGRIENARKAAIILTEMLEEFGVAHTVVAFTADSYGVESVEHYRLVKWGESEKHRLMCYQDANNNRDGYSLRVATEELFKRPEKAKLLLMLSDGLPEAENCIANRRRFDRKDRVLNDVASAVEEAKEKKVDVLHLYFGGTERETLEKVAFMYPKLSVITNPVDVPSAVADIVVSTLQKYM